MNRQLSHWVSNRDFGFLALTALMISTRFHHEGSEFQLPDASLAVFFLAGFYFSGLKRFFVLLAVAGFVDYFAITALGVSDYCISPAYLFLVPTYWVLWAGGQWLSNTLSLNPLHQAAEVLPVLLLTGFIAFMISSWSFYWFSGKPHGMNAHEYASWLASGLFSYLMPILAYCLFGMFVATGYRLLKAGRVFVITR